MNVTLLRFAKLLVLAHVVGWSGFFLLRASQRRALDDDTVSRAEPIAIVVIACNRVGIARTLNSLVEAGVDEEWNGRRFALFVSLDACNGQEATLSVVGQFPFVRVLRRPKSDRNETALRDVPKHLHGYYRLAGHYRWALDEIFKDESEFGEPEQ